MVLFLCLLIGGFMIEVYFAIRTILLIAVIVIAVCYTIYKIWEWYH